MKKALFPIVFVAMMVCAGCGDDTEINLPEDGQITVDDSQNVDITIEQPDKETPCGNPTLEKVACTSARRIDGLLDPAPYVVSDWIYERAEAANRQCKDFADIVWIYREAIRGINAGDDPDTVKFWFLETMAAVVDYDPTIECDGGCEG